MRIKFLILILILNVGCAYCLQSDLYGNYDDEASSASKYGTWIGDTYYNNNYSHPVSYTKQDNQIYGSNGKSYTQFGNTIQDNSSGKTYQINNNLIQPLYQ